MVKSSHCMLKPNQHSNQFCLFENEWVDMSPTSFLPKLDYLEGHLRFLRHTSLLYFEYLWKNKHSNISLIIYDTTNQKPKHNDWDFEVQATKMCKRFEIGPVFAARTLLGSLNEKHFAISQQNSDPRVGFSGYMKSFNVTPLHVFFLNGRQKKKFAKIWVSHLSQKLWQNKNLCVQEGVPRRHGPPQKNWLSKMSLWPRFLTHLGHEFVEPPNWSLFFWSWPGIFWGTKSEPKIWGRPNLGSRFVYIWHMNKT